MHDHRPDQLQLNTHELNCWFGDSVVLVLSSTMRNIQHMELTSLHRQVHRAGGF